jgi:hypothetical protein
MDGRVMGVVPFWIQQHCVVPDGFLRGRPLKLYGYQRATTVAMYQVRLSASFEPERPMLRTAFVHQLRGLVVGPQKIGKDPLAAALICLEGTGPALFAGWAGRDEGYICADFGCRCGWEYPYDEGEPKGMPWPTPLIQITGVSEGSTDNTYDALRPMIELGRLADLVPKTGEDFIRLPRGGKIETVTSSAPARLGQRTTYVVQGETGLYTDRNGMSKVARTQYRNLAGMGGRALETTNAWDPALHSVAQVDFEQAAKMRKAGEHSNVWTYFVQPPANLSFSDKRERRKILRTVYEPDLLRENGGHVELESIESEAADMITKAPAEAARFFGNKLEEGAGRAFELGRWNGLSAKKPHKVPKGALVVLGFDGSRSRDHTALVATEVASGYQWPLGIWRPGDYKGHQIPGELVDAAVDQAFERFDVWRMYADPPFWVEWVAVWAGRYGKDRVVEWLTGRPRQMAYAIRAWREAMNTGAVWHCPETDALCALFSEHVGNAVMHPTGYRDDGGELYTIEKPSDGEKIDTAVAATLSWEARNDAITDGALNVEVDNSEPFVFVQ